MKMYDKNGKLSPVGQAIFNSGMERLRTGEDALSIAKDLVSQVKLIEFNGDPLKTNRSFRVGWYFWLFKNVTTKEFRARPKTIIAPIGTMTGRLSKTHPNLSGFPIEYKESPFLTDRIIQIP